MARDRPCQCIHRALWLKLKGDIMSEETRNEMANVEIEPLNDDELDSVAGGLAAGSDSCCCTTGGGGCSNAEDIS